MSNLNITANTLLKKVRPLLNYFRELRSGSNAKKLVYVCSPLRGDVDLNRFKAIEYSKYVAKLGHIPITPHAYFTTFLDDNLPKDRELGMDMGKQLLFMCDEIWVFGDVLSDGMKKEICLANEFGIKVKYISFPSVLATFNEIVRA